MKTTLTLILAIACLTFCQVQTSSAQDGVDGTGTSGVWTTVPIAVPTGDVTYWLGGDDSSSGFTLELPVADINGPIQFDQFNGIFGNIDGITISDGSDAISSVPEPTTLSLAALSTLIFLWRVRRITNQRKTS